MIPCLASDRISAMPKKPTAYNEAIGKRLEQLRVAKGFDTIRAFAKSINVHEDTYRAWERGDNRIPANVVSVLCKRYKGLTHDWIYDGDEGGIPGRLLEELKRAA